MLLPYRDTKFRIDIFADKNIVPGSSNAGSNEPDPLLSPFVVPINSPLYGYVNLFDSLIFSDEYVGKSDALRAVVLGTYKLPDAADSDRQRYGRGAVWMQDTPLKQAFFDGDSVFKKGGLLARWQLLYLSMVFKRHINKKILTNNRVDKEIRSFFIDWYGSSYQKVFRADSVRYESELCKLKARMKS